MTDTAGSNLLRRLSKELDAAPPTAKPGGRRYVRRRDRRFTYWLFCLPALLVLAIVIGIPTGYTIRLSTFNYNLLLNTKGETGLRNYWLALQDRGLWLSVFRTLVYIVVTGVCDLVIGLAQALLVFQIGGAAAKALKGLFILPILLIHQ